MFRITPEVFNTVDVNSCSLSPWEFTLSMIHTKVSFTFRINKTIISFPSITIENRFIKIHFSLNDGSECISFTVWYNLCVYFHSPIFIFSLDESEYWLFHRSPSSFEFSSESPLSFCTEVTFIYFYLSSYFFSENIYAILIDNLSKYPKISICGIWIYIQ